MLVKQDAFQLDRVAVKKLNKKEYAVSCWNSLNVRRRSEHSAGSMVSEAAVKPRAKTGQAAGSHVRYRETVIYAIPQNGFSLFPALVRLAPGFHRTFYVAR